MGLRGYVLKRLGYSVILIILALSFNFYLFMLMPGNPEDLFVPARGISQSEMELFKAQFRHNWGLDQPLYMQYLVYIKNMFTWNFGTTMSGSGPVADQMMLRIPWTILLIGASTVISITVGIVTGVICAHKRGSKLDNGIVATGLMLGSLPTFWLGLVFIEIVSGWLAPGWPTGHIYPVEWGVGNTPFPYAFTITGGTIRVNPSGALTLVGGILQHAFLPVLTLSVFLFGGYTLLTRATMLESLTEDYIVTARAKGVNETAVLFKHALKNASLPIITSVALAFGFLFSGAAITETVFSWEGLGLWIFQSVQAKDYFSMQAIFYIITLCVIIANIVADFVYGIVDPRIKYG
jgi:peptide/nickel transport system permease protein